MSKIRITDIQASGTPSSTTYLRGDGSWNTPAGGGGGFSRPSIVQVGGVIGGSYSVTMPAAPTPGNLLLAFCMHWNALSGTGTPADWNLIKNANGSVLDGTAASMKIASSTDTSTLVPFTGGTGGQSTIIYEVSGALAVLPLNVILVDEDTSSPFDVSITGSRANSIILGGVFRGGSNGAFTVSPYNLDLNITGTTANNSPRRAQAVSLATDVGTNGSISLPFTGGNFAAALVEIFGG